MDIYLVDYPGDHGRDIGPAGERERGYEA